MMADWGLESQFTSRLWPLKVAMHIQVVLKVLNLKKKIQEV